jgi:hypothetical protein
VTFDVVLFAPELALSFESVVVVADAWSVLYVAVVVEVWYFGCVVVVVLV